MTQPLAAVFLDGGEGRVFSLLRRPSSGPVRGCVLVAPPFAEEMNKSRRMLTQLGTALCERGIALLQVDLFGTGDSEGDFSVADWEHWKRDLRLAAAWSEQQGCRVTGVVGIRLGCALAAEIELPGLRGTAFWQPVLDGNRMLDQFLRLRVAASMMSADRETTAGLRARLAAGEIVEIAGYPLSGKLAAQLDAVRLGARIGPALGRLCWLEVVRSAATEAPTPAMKAVDQLRASGVAVDLATVVGEPFWSVVEIVSSPELLARTRAFFLAALSADVGTSARALEGLL